MQSVLLYKFFLANEDNSISFSRLKNYIKIMESLAVPSPDWPLPRLIESGVVERIADNRFKLSPSCYVHNRKICLGVNIPNNLITNHQSETANNCREGLQLFKYSPTFVDYGIDVREFDFMSIFRCYISLSDLAKCHLQEAKRIGTSKPKHIFVPENGRWANCETSCKGGDNLYKVFVTDDHYYYLFERITTYSQQAFTCIIQRGDIEMLNLFKSLLCLTARNTGLTYHRAEETLKIGNSYPMPIRFKKLLFINHVLSTGTFPTNGKYHLQRRYFNQLQRPFNNKIISNE